MSSRENIIVDQMKTSQKRGLVSDLVEGGTWTPASGRCDEIREPEVESPGHSLPTSAGYYLSTLEHALFGLVLAV